MAHLMERVFDINDLMKAWLYMVLFVSKTWFHLVLKKILNPKEQLDQSDKSQTTTENKRI